MQVSTRRRLAVISVSVLVVLAVIYGFMPRAVTVDVKKAVRGPLRVTIDEEGKTRVKDRFVVSAPVSGFMRRVDYEVGDRVSKGQTVVSIEPSRSSVLDPRSRAEAQAAVSAAQAELKAAKENVRAATADAEYSRQSFERNKKLAEEGYIARDVLDQAEAEVKRNDAGLLSAKAAVQTARAELERARAALRYSAVGETVDYSKIVTVQTPVTGSVLKIHRKSEGAVSVGEPLIDIGDPSILEVKVEVLSAEAVNIRPEIPVLFERWGGDIPLKGRVKTVEPEAFTKVSSLGVEEQRVLVIADITSLPEEWQRLGDEYRVEASFIIWEGADVLQVPESALFRKDGGWAVFVVKGNNARLRQVQVGHRNGLSAEVISGISEGETVIVYPDESIRDGRRVRIR
jgi:HlyD family secretion protein